MQCPHCGREENKVAETRTCSSGIYRRRKCLGCGENFISCESTSKTMTFPQEIRDAIAARLRERRERLTHRPMQVNLTKLPW
jgi:transcriptional regulator NrdR family protein